MKLTCQKMLLLVMSMSLLMAAADQKRLVHQSPMRVAGIGTNAFLRIEGKSHLGNTMESKPKEAAAGTHTHTALTLKEIFQKTGTDKLWRHGYHRYYEKQLAPYRNIDGVSILEIGADSGISLGAWMDYFQNPETVQGIAYNVSADAARKKACEIMPEGCSKLRIYSMDQGNVTALADLVKQNPKGWDIIIDDGSHVPQHQLISFQRL